MKYRHIIFDLEGTLVEPDFSVSAFLGNLSGQFASCAGVRPLVQGLKSAGFTLGAISTYDEHKARETLKDMGLLAYFSELVGTDNSARQTGTPLERYLKKTEHSRRDVLFVTSTDTGLKRAQKESVDCVLALWCSPDSACRAAVTCLKRPADLAVFLGQPSEKAVPEPWLAWAVELQFIAQAGQTYSKDAFDLERFDRIRDIAAEIMAEKTGLSMERVSELFCNETGFQTPKLDTRAAIFRDGEILLVRESQGKWSLPGGWVDVDQSIASNTVKEVKEEAGLDVEPVRLIAVLDGNRKQAKPCAYGVCKLFVLCEARGGRFQPNPETTDSAYFALDHLPPLFTEKNTEEHIRMCFLASADENWQVLFD